MRNPRIYQPIQTTPGETIKLDGDAVRHLIQVLRLRQGDRFCLFNGRGKAWQATLDSIDKRQVSACIQEEVSQDTESPLATQLGLGISKGERMDYAIQKAVELGVNEITPLFTRYSMVKLDEKRKDKRQQHWQGIIISACEQCGRNQLPVLHEPVDVQTWLDNIDTEQKLLLDPLAKQHLKDITQKPGSTSLLIGPEGGLSDEELDTARQSGFTGIQLGPRVLRTETAVVAALTAIQVIWGDLNN